MEWLKQQHRALWRFYQEEFGESLLITAAAFLVICLLAFGVGLFFKSLPDTIISYFQEMIQLEGLIDEDGGINLLALFGNNVRASAVSILYGFIPFLYLTALALGTNALILGVFAAYYVNNGVSLLVYLAGILPHGIFELTALMLAFAGGFLLCRQITQYKGHDEAPDAESAAGVYPAYPAAAGGGRRGGGLCDAPRDGAFYVIVSAERAVKGESYNERECDTDSRHLRQYGVYRGEDATAPQP